MPTSQNGWSANDPSKIASFTIPGTDRKIALRKGDCSVVLLDFLAWFDKNVESIDGGQLDDWGYAERPIRGQTAVLSNHASGTAVDVNSPRHPLGHRNTFTGAQIKLIRTKLAQYHGVIRWGGDYKGRADEMHFEINAGATAVREQADRIRGKVSTQPLPAPKPAVAKVLGLTNPLTTGDLVREVQRALVKCGNTHLAVDGRYTKETADLVNVFKKHRGFSESGCGSTTLAALRLV